MISRSVTSKVAFDKQNADSIIFDLRIWLLLFVFSTICLILVSPDSYLHDLTHRHDSAWFFMGGKAWFNGMTPYVEFSDSKGLLLWLIYGIGYLISPTNYIGVFWLSCLAYSFTLYFCYRIGALILNNRVKGMVTAMLMMIPYMLWWFHYETRAEDWCHPFCACSLLVLIRTAFGREAPILHGFTLGVSIGAALMIKWSIAVMLASIAISVLLLMVMRKLKWGITLFWIIAGLISILLPFSFYLLHKGIFQDFLQEYFITTLTTVSYGGLSDTLAQYWWEIKHLAFYMRFVYVLYLIAALLWWRYDSRVTILPFLCGCFFLLISIHHDMHYYITIVSTFAIWSVLWIQKFMGKWQCTLQGLMTIGTICILGMFWNISVQDNLIWQPSERRKQFDEINKLMSAVDNPRILHSAHETGLGIQANTLPAIKYWAMQSGGGRDMEESMYHAIMTGIPDFVTVQIDGFRQEFADSVTASNLYEKCAEYYNHSGHIIEVWSRKGLPK